MTNLSSNQLVKEKENYTSYHNVWYCFYKNKRIIRRRYNAYYSTSIKNSCKLTCKTKKYNYDLPRNKKSCITISFISVGDLTLG